MQDAEAARLVSERPASIELFFDISDAATYVMAKAADIDDPRGAAYTVSLGAQALMLMVMENQPEEGGVSYHFEGSITEFITAESISELMPKSVSPESVYLSDGSFSITLSSEDITDILEHNYREVDVHIEANSNNNTVKFIKSNSYWQDGTIRTYNTIFCRDNITAILSFDVKEVESGAALPSRFFGLSNGGGE